MGFLEGTPSQLEPTPEVVSALERYLELLEAGEAPSPEEYVSGHPEIAAPLRAGLASLDFLHGAAGGFRSSMQAPGKALGDFRIVREIGRGGMGVVYEAEQLSLGRRVALKVLPFAGAMDQRQRARFRHEAQIAACLHHPHIVPVYAVGSERGVHYFAMQLIEGRPLSDFIAPARLGPGEGNHALGETAVRSGTAPTPPGRLASDERFRTAARLMAQAAEALEYAHSLGVIHRDIKPGNLMLDASGHLWVTDFGLAQAKGDPRITLSGDIVGTLRYMAPEQAAGGAFPADPRADVYSLGATLYEMLTLRPAFDHPDRRELLRQVAIDEPIPPRRVNRDIPAELEVLVLKAMAKSPQDRYPTARSLKEDLERWLEGKPIQARPPSLYQRAARLVRRNRGAAIATACFTFLLAAALVAWAWREALHAEARAATAEAQRAEVQEALKREEEQRRIADSRTSLALQVLDRVYLRLAEDHLPRAPASLEQERVFIAEALKAYGKLELDSARAEEVRVEAAIARCRAGCLQAWLGLDAEAEKTLHEAITRLNSLPATQRVRDALASGQTRLGTLRLARGEAEAGLGHLKKACQASDQPRLQARAASLLAAALEKEGRLEEAESLLVSSLAARDISLARASLTYQLASLRLRTHGPAEALALLDEAAGQWRKSLEESREDASARQQLVLCLSTAGELYRLRGEMSKSLNCHEAASGLALELLRAWPGVPGYRRLSARVAGDRAKALADAGSSDSRAVLRDAVAQARLLVSQDEWAVRTWPGTRAHRAALAEDSALAAALTLLGGGNEKDALPLCRRAADEYATLCSQSPASVDWKESHAGARHNLALCLHRLGRTMEAIRELEASRDLWRSLPATGARNAQVACAWLQVGVMRRKAEGDKAAEAAYLEAINLYRPLTRAAGCTARELGEHGQACNNLANILFARGDNTEAARMYREAAAAGESLAVNFPADTTCRTLRLYPRLMLARIKARAGEVADAYREVCSLPRRAPDVKEASFRAAEMLMAIREDLLASTAPAAVKRGMASRIEETAIRLLISGPLPDGALEMPVFRPLAGHRDLEALRGKVIR